ncbi:membrane protein DedA with SNARE-associated domain [Bacillus pakistanensis]|uniref:Membrane protein DedA with SNARE-associated domain n=1 Tax=Rossellomorea pakistanensis TaxID=992288 RepID=A0ABS2N7J5_9BACI|nr:DedA family protein [Bacillus pakistanensis]MBM7583744.1 membrane protein DedA with SNARE-associated domain [Bacillus pakistanensis]
MVQQFLEWLHVIGLPGLFLVMFLEGSSLPFPGLIIVLSYGYIISPGYLNSALIAIGMSISYCLASLIPYYFGMKLERYFPNKLKKGLKKAIAYFNRYGIWSIALSRPFGIGNYISYVAGISRVNIYKYLILTFIGIYPWSYVMIILGDYFNGNYEALKRSLSSYSIYIYGAVVVVILMIILFYNNNSKQEKAVWPDKKERGQGS